MIMSHVHHQLPHQPTEFTPILTGPRKSTRRRAPTIRPGLYRPRPRAHPFQYLDKPQPCVSPSDFSDTRQLESSPLLPKFSTGTAFICTDIPDNYGGAWQKFDQVGSQKDISCDDSRHTTSSSSSRFSLNLPENISLRLENSGSVARDHLASERTFLAYMRTSLAIASSGVAIIQLFSGAAPLPHGAMSLDSTDRFHLYIRPLGASIIAIGLFVLFIGVKRYFTIQAALTKGYFPVTRLGTGFIAIALTVLVTLTFGILLAGKTEPR